MVFLTEFTQKAIEQFCILKEISKIQISKTKHAELLKKRIYAVLIDLQENFDL